MKRNEQGLITELGSQDVFVFGANLQGNHAGGAARQAHNDFGAIWGVGVGLQGQSYAIPTMEISRDNIGLYIQQFLQFAKAMPHLTFYVTAIGTGIAGFNEAEMDELWGELPNNVVRV